jgi:D-glucosaminate-specific PTS system IIB component
MGIKLERVDYRLMHGQVVTNWIKIVSADAILIVNDELVKDKFLAQVFLMAAPPGVKISIKSIANAAKWAQTGKQNQMNLLVLFKSIESAKQAHDLGFPMEKLQIGGLGSGTNKKVVSKDLSLSDDEIEMLNELNQKGVEISLQAMPKDEKIMYSDIAGKLTSN